jgi:hypothetical protein
VIHQQHERRFRREIRFEFVLSFRREFQLQQEIDRILCGWFPFETIERARTKSAHLQERG